MKIVDHFHETLDERWQVTQIRYGRVRTEPGALRLTVAPTPDGQYSNAQITDYDYESFRFDNRPPLRLTVRAHASAPGDGLVGTAGFGFWNHPFSPDIRRLPQLPRAAWFFFGSPPNDMRLALGVPGSGWKAAAIDAGRPAALALAPLAGPSVLLMRSPALYARLWPPIQAALGIHEHLLDPALLAERHTYTLDWRVDGLTFAVDGQTVLTAQDAPRGPLGFVAWMDNQYAVVTPQGKLRFGLIPVGREQSLVLESVAIE